MALIRAKEAAIKIGSPLSSVGTSTTFESQITGQVDFSGKVRDVTISGGESDTEQVFLFGVDANSRQNMDSYQKPMTLREFSGTLILVDNLAMGLNSGLTSSVGSTGYTRIQGDGTIPQKAVLCKFTSQGGSILSCVLNNFKFTKLGDIKLDSEGYGTQEIAGKCLPRDYYEEYHA